MKKKRRKKILITIVAIIAIIAIGIGGYQVKERIRINNIIKSHQVEASEVTAVTSEKGIARGVQQIMIGSLCTSYDNALQTLLNIKAAGYDSIELNDFMISETGLLVKMMTKMAGMPIGNGGKLDWESLIAESGLNVVSLHSNLGSIEADATAVADNAKKFGTDTVVITGMYRFDYSSLEEVESLAARLNEAGKALSEQGIRLLYHNHNCELQKVSADKTAYDIIIEETDSAYVNFEFDSYWMTDGGANTAAIMEKLGSRMKLWHINDRGCKQDGPYMTPILKQNAAELGYGNMDLETLSDIALSNGVEGVILETHQNWVNNDPIESMILSSEFMKAHF